MSHKSFSIKIDEPCSQNWNEMTAEGNGRFCSHCTRVVVDFTLMSENQIKDFFKNYNGEVCGRIQDHRLELKYTYNTHKTPWYANRFLQYALSGFLTLKVIDINAAQSQNVPSEVVRMMEKENQGDSKFSTSPEARVKKMIEGKVVGHNGQTGLGNTTVRIEETGQSTTTDSNGKFNIELQDDYKGEQITITFSHINYESVSRTIEVSEIPVKKLTVRMFSDNHIKMGKIMYTPE